MMSTAKKKRPSQIPIEFPLDTALGREDMIESPANALAISVVDAWPDWPGRFLVVAGPVGSGKSHLASVWAGASQAKICDSSQLTGKARGLLEWASQGKNLVLEDVGETPIDQNALFHLVNAVNQGNGFCLVTTRQWPGSWDIDLPDLKSRVRSFQVTELKEPDDILLKQVMVKLFADRQLLVSDAVIDYCAVRMERSLQSAGRLVEMIDQISLAGKAPVTRAIASRALSMIETGEI